MVKLDLTYEGGGSWFADGVGATVPDPAYCLAFPSPKERDEVDQWRLEALALREGMAKLAEAFGWSQVREEDGGLNIPPVEDIIERAKQVNVNDDVWVKLTPAGLKQYTAEPIRQTIRAFHPQYAEPVQEVMKFSLWELMGIFGPGMHNGAPALFDKQAVYFQDPTKAPTLTLLKDEADDAPEPR